MEYALRVCQKRDFMYLKEIYLECVELHQKNGYFLKKLPDAPEIFLQYVEELMDLRMPWSWWPQVIRG